MRFLSSDLTTIHGQSVVSVWKNTASYTQFRIPPGYCRVALIVIIDEPEPFGPLPVARTEKVSLPLYPTLDVYT